LRARWLRNFLNGASGRATGRILGAIHRLQRWSCMTCCFPGRRRMRCGGRFWSTTQRSCTVF